MALTKYEMHQLSNIFGSAKAAKEIVTCIAARTMPSKATQLVFASVFCDNLYKKYGTATQETLHAFLDGRTLSAKTQRKIVLTFADPKLANKIINMIQLSPSPVIKL